MSTGPQDEDLPSNAPSPRRRRLTVAAVVLIGLAVVAGIAVRLVDSRSGPSATPTVTVGPSPAESGSRGVTTSRATSSPAPGLTRALPPIPSLNQLTQSEISAAHAHCPRLAPGCQTTGETPSAVLAAVKDAFPDARHYVAVSDLVYTDENVPFLAYRRLTVRAGRGAVSVEIARSQPGDGVGFQRVGSFVRYQNVADGITTEVQVSAGGDAEAATARARRLADDRRLTDIG